MGDLTRPNQGKKVVLVTGFGPFRNHGINPSWEAVKELSKLGLNQADCHLVVREIPVTYKAVKTEIPRLWKELKPYLAVHVGVSDLAQELTLECLAHNDGYIQNDADGKKNDSTSCCADGPPSLKTELRMDEICDCVNKDQCDVMAVTSTDAGRYLCDFIYYTSLAQDCSRVAFIHVPTFDSYTAIQLAQGIQVAISAMLLQLRDNENPCH